MNFQAIIDQVIEKLGGESKHHQSVSLHSNGRKYVICDNGNNFTVYKCMEDGTFLPNSKQGKTFRTISNFCNQ